jgi:murein L,D-transpeptidase YcbB/YkuD
LFWYDTSSPTAATFRIAVLQSVNNMKYYGLDRRKYKFPDSSKTGNNLFEKDRQFTAALIDMVFDLYEGADIDRYISNDELTTKFESATDSTIAAWMKGLYRQPGIEGYLALPEPGDSTYNTLKAALRVQTDSGNTAKTTKLVAAVNMYRWINHFHFHRYIVVNIPSAVLTVYEHDEEVLRMKVVAGKPSTRTPRFSTWCDKVILYPYWNVPTSIARKELLPIFKKSPEQVKKMNMQIIDGNGKQANPYSLNWSSFNRSYFPYTIRQCTGCDNALGVIKFNLTDPFSVYMHDTNFKPAFSSPARYFSHGCIRVEQPLELGNYLLNGQLDSNFLKACIRGQEPVTIVTDAPVPVFVVYIPVTVANNSVNYLRDIYHLY